MGYMYDQQFEEEIMAADDIDFGGMGEDRSDRKRV